MNYSDPSGHNPINCQDLPGNPEPAVCIYPPGNWGGIGSGLGGNGGSGGSSCGTGMSPETKTVGCCPPGKAFAPCIGNGGSGPGYGIGGATGSLSGSITGPNNGGGTGGTGSGPRPDPATAARQANRAAAMNNPLPIPGALLAPLYGGSLTGPVSSAPDVPSKTTSDYQNPIDDINKTYQDLENSLTADDDTLLGSLNDTLAAPSEVTPANYQPGADQDQIDQQIADAHKNGTQCGVFTGEMADFQSTCIAMAPSPDFQEDLSNEALLEGLEVATELMRGASILGLGATALTGCVLSVVCAGMLAASTPEGAAFTPWVYSALLARGLGLLGSGGVVAGGASRWRPPPLTVSSGQFGRKFGQHAEDFGISFRDPRAREKFRDIIDDIYNNPDEVRVGPYYPKDNGGVDHLFFMLDDYLLILKADGTFVSVWPNAGDNAWFLGARAIE